MRFLRENPLENLKCRGHSGLFINFFIQPSDSYKVYTYTIPLHLNTIILLIMLCGFLLYVNFGTIYGHTLFLCLRCLAVYHLVRMTGFRPSKMLCLLPKQIML